jgi:zinc D-Ala-D-Ala dipeptidase
MHILRSFSFLAFVLLLCSAVSDHKNSSYFKMQDSTWAEVNFQASGIVNKMAYATEDNFMKQQIYPCARCFLRPEVAEMLDSANEIAKDKNLRLVIYDCYRPYSYQKVMYDIVNDPRYVAPPGKGSYHNRGAAVDIALADENGELLDMGGAFDDFSDISHYDNDKVSDIGWKNRKLLRKIMVKAGFTPLSSEWWHFDYREKRYPVSVFKWDCSNN